MRFHPGIQISRIPVEGGGGLIFAIGMVLIVVLAMPAVRPLALLSILGGVILAPVLHRLNH
jgi:hypothetical protein